MIAEPLDAADEMCDDAFEGGDVDGAMEVEVGPRVRSGVRVERHSSVILLQGLHLTDQGLQGTTWNNGRRKTLDLKTYIF